MECEGKKMKKKGTNKKVLKSEMQYDVDMYELEKKYEQNSINDYKNSQYLSSKEKNELEKRFSLPRNTSQYKFMSCLKKHNNRVVIASGPAGTGKTLFGVEMGIRYYLEGIYEKIIFTRPVVTVDEDIGYLPGTLEEKLNPYLRPLFDILYNFISPKEVKSLIEEKIIEIAPLGMMRGRTFKNCWIVADEMQNSSISQMKMLLTRIGENSRLIITGDLEQNDRKGEINGLEDFLGRLKGRRSDSISSVEFDRKDIERENVVKEVLDIYESEVIPPHYIDTVDDTVDILYTDENIENNDLKK
jgi:phosphate starvation-inducible PhoH-like protein